ncbi:gamma-glutamyl-gamma-aminobutyrate hydrolase family protein [Kitasatospora terrestris]|uniref:Gamma-glutamyl-gamma-aminobutyrate hydrolase family protein n=1 Tax=Kitasatospora terrestris TaxID=258051 RepID=A0ABP9EMQ6_9ACTN
MKPLIGITTYREPARWSVWEQGAALLPESYVEAVERAGGTAVLLPPQGEIGRLVEVLDGLVVAGGADVDPARYGAEPHPRTGAPQHARDTWELALLRAALEAGLPVLGVCRGMQVLNVALGGDLVQHLPDGSHQDPPGVFVKTEVRTADGSRIASILGADVQVNCYHHQAIGRLGLGLHATAWSADGVVEAVERSGRGFALGVQWHPETDLSDLRLFEALTAAAVRNLDSQERKVSCG